MGELTPERPWSVSRYDLNTDPEAEEALVPDICGYWVAFDDYRILIDEVERLRTDLRESLVAQAKLEDDVDALEGYASDLRKDKERLDWIESRATSLDWSLWNSTVTTLGRNTYKGDNWREAIDASMEAGK